MNAQPLCFPVATLLSMWILSALCGVATAADDPSQPRAEPPEWPQDVVDVFFEDARSALVGPRPDFQAAQVAATKPATPLGESSDDEAGSGVVWTELVDADTLETEIKRQLTSLQKLTATPSAFKGGGYRGCRVQFTWLATLFAVADDYDDSVRWQREAEALAQLFGRAGANCKVGTDQTYREAQLRVQDLADLVRGGRPDTPPVKPDVGWDQISSRTPLMKRMEVAINQRLSPNASDGRALKANADDLLHESQLLAMMAQVIVQPGFDDADDESYAAHAHGLRDAAVSFGKAVDLQTFQAARESLGNMQKACSNCHDEWR